jgi:hypothetical protein
MKDGIQHISSNSLNYNVLDMKDTHSIYHSHTTYLIIRHLQ